MEEVSVQRSSQWAWGLILKACIFARRSKRAAPEYAIRFMGIYESNLPLEENLLCLYVARYRGEAGIVAHIIGDAAF